MDFDLLKPESLPFVGIPLAVVAIGLLVALVMYLGRRRRARKRREALQRMAPEIGLTYVPGQSPVSLEEIRSYQSMEGVQSPWIGNVLTGTVQGLPLTVFDLHYTLRGSDAWYASTCVRLAQPGTRWPHFTIGPEGFFHKVGSIFGFQDIDFKTHPELTDRFLLRGENEEMIRAFFDETLLTELCGFTEIYLESRYDILLIRRRRLREPMAEAYQRLIDDSARLFRCFVAAAERFSAGGAPAAAGVE